MGPQIVSETIDSVTYREAVDFEVSHRLVQIRGAHFRLRSVAERLLLRLVRVAQASVPTPATRLE